MSSSRFDIPPGRRARLALLGDLSALPRQGRIVFAKSSKRLVSDAVRLRGVQGPRARDETTSGADR